jgi:hypothetical protein
MKHPKSFNLGKSRSPQISVVISLLDSKTFYNEFPIHFTHTNLVTVTRDQIMESNPEIPYNPQNVETHKGDQRLLIKKLLTTF